MAAYSRPAPDRFDESGTAVPCRVECVMSNPARGRLDLRPQFASTARCVARVGRRPEVPNHRSARPAVSVLAANVGLFSLVSSVTPRSSLRRLCIATASGTGTHHEEPSCMCPRDSSTKPYWRMRHADIVLMNHDEPAAAVQSANSYSISHWICFATVLFSISGHAPRHDSVNSSSSISSRRK